MSPVHSVTYVSGPDPKGLVGASGFEPPTSWSRTKNSKILSRFGGVAYGLKPLFFEPLIEPNLNLSACTVRGICQSLTSESSPHQSVVLVQHVFAMNILRCRRASVKLQPAFDLGSQDPVLYSQIFVPQKEFL